MRRRRLRIDAPDLNLVPLLDMVSLLIQMLLVDAQFGVYAEVQSAVAAGTTEAQGEQLGLAVRIARTGFLVQWIEGGNALERSVPCPGDGCADVASWDGPGLRAALGEIKDRHPEEQSLVLLPEAGVPFEVVVRTMDLTRDDGARRVLFPDLVVGP